MNHQNVPGIETAQKKKALDQLTKSDDVRRTDEKTSCWNHTLLSLLYLRSFFCSTKLELAAFGISNVFNPKHCWS
jgi:hypothetical protein